MLEILNQRIFSIDLMILIGLTLAYLTRVAIARERSCNSQERKSAGSEGKGGRDATHACGG